MIYSQLEKTKKNFYVLVFIVERVWLPPVNSILNSENVIYSTTQVQKYFIRYLKCQGRIKPIAW